MTSLFTDKEDELATRAAVAVRHARRMLPMLTAFARVLTRNHKVKLSLTSGTPCTDGQTILINPPWGLGVDGPHEGCRVRDEYGALTCDQCQIEEDNLITLIHEIAHIVHDSFEKMSDAERARLLKEVLKVASGKDAPPLLKKMQHAIARASVEDGFVSLANKVAPEFAFVHNVVEDLRVNTEMMTARPGTRKMFHAQFRKVLTDGISTEQGENIMWADKPLNGQAIIGFYCHAMDFNPEGHLDPGVVEDMLDPRITQRVNELKTVRSTGDAIRLAVRVYTTLWELGYFRSEEDEDEGQGDDSEDTESSDDHGGEADETAESDDSQDSDDEQSGGSGDGTDDEEDDSEGGDADGESDDSSDDGDGSSKDYGSLDEVREMMDRFSNHDGDRITDQEGNPLPSDDPVEEAALERAIEQADHFDTPTRNIEGLRLIHGPEDDAMAGGYGCYHRHAGPVCREARVNTEVLAPALRRLRMIFTNNKRANVDRNRKRGPMIVGSKLATRVPAGDPRLFGKRTQPGKRDYFVLIGFDLSGSTSHYSMAGEHLVTHIKDAVATQAELLKRLGIRFAVYGHTGYTDLRIYEIKTANEPWGKKQKSKLDALWSGACNLDGHTMEFYRKRLLEQDATDRILLYYTDGAMPAENYHEELEILQRELRILSSAGAIVLGVGINTDAPKEHGLETVMYRKPSDITALVKALEVKLS